MANYVTKPLQVRCFNLFREIIIGWKHVSELEKLLPPPPKEHDVKMDEV